MDPPAEDRPVSDTAEVPGQVLASGEASTRQISSSPDPIQMIRLGDRAVAAEFLIRHEALIRRRYRQRLGHALRRLVDSQDLLATIARRFDRCVMDGVVRAESERQLWAMVFRIGDHALADKGRLFRRLARTEGPDSDWAHECRRRLVQADAAETEGWAVELDALLTQFTDTRDRRILTLWLMGDELGAIATELAMSPAAVRKRWERIRKRLRAQVAPGLERTHRSSRDGRTD